MGSGLFFRRGEPAGPVEILCGIWPRQATTFGRMWARCYLTDVELLNGARRGDAEAWRNWRRTARETSSILANNFYIT